MTSTVEMQMHANLRNNRRSVLLYVLSSPRAAEPGERGAQVVGANPAVFCR